MKPIIFNTEMVKAILDGRKSQTRIVEKLTHQKVLFEDGEAICEECGQIRYAHTEGYCLNCSIKKSKYKIGDILYVKETFGFRNDVKEFGITYKADWLEENKMIDFVKPKKWYPSTYLKKEYARIFLKITNIKVERLQDMRIEDFLKEGINDKGFVIEKPSNSLNEYYEYLKGRWVKLWNSTAKDGYKWEDNPYVFVYDFDISEREE